MNRAEFLRRAGAGAAGLALAASAPRRTAATAQARRPNILLIMTDDQPHYTIENMTFLQRRLIAAGTRFDNAYVATPVCGPARGSVLTGKWSHNTGLESTDGAWRDLVDSGELVGNVAARLKAVGYSCHLTGKFTNDLTNDDWVCPGFDSWWAQLEDLNDPDFLYFSEGGAGRREMPRNSTEAGNETMVAAKYTEDFVRSRKDTPWFACFWPHAPHGPYYPLGRYAEAHKDDKPPTPFGEPERDLSDKAPLVRQSARFSPAAEEEMMQEYRGKLREVEEVDDGVKRLVTALEETDQLGHTWIFFITDNGYQHGEHYLDKKLWPYEESCRTPLVVRGPGVPAGSVSKQLVSQIDLLPTICEIAGADASGVDGRSILPTLRDPGAPTREFLLIEAEGRGWSSVRMRRRNRARTGYDNLLFVKWRDGFEEVYDYDDDPRMYEGHFDTPREQRHADVLRERLDAMRAAAGDAYRALERS
ncbi:MAG: Choline-sulfatase [uncultured Rubrobacteraceae bacterium]|uniref:Choline-sulfatase n=1 Tax=uncultured Rubrobacteraceae bacterium TaxID=349277 RepID=A0A6J4NI63_9ACTN|nr:MAG: Choline-sulfatase [uncultured Rubrobacteraceae bacterium]